MILPWFWWWKQVERRRLLEILLFGLNVTNLCLILDGIGSNALAWGYPIMLVPFLVPLFSSDISVIPIAYMVVYQRYRTWKTFLIGCTIVTLLFSFIGEPFLRWCGIYEQYTWKDYYSFPIYIVIGLFCRWLNLVLVRSQQAAK